MSRLAKKPIQLPKGVEVMTQADVVNVKGPKGSLSQKLIKGIVIKVADEGVTINLENNTGYSFLGLYRALVVNMIKGVTEGFEKKLQMIGVGYRAAVSGQSLDLQVGYSNPIKMPIPQGLTVKVEKNTQITVSGLDKHLVGQFSADIRSKRKPEPYKGKGIRYEGEYVRKKSGKTAKTG
ncbi:MAG: 50S ribosomal protein L6 [Chlamydiae bacterium]|nr:50S ribosomal protein L6 [Chlamydiota bacterium]